MASAEITEGHGLQQFVVLAKNSKGKAASALIQQVLAAPNVFVFGELLDSPNFQQVCLLGRIKKVNVFSLLKPKKRSTLIY